MQYQQQYVFVFVFVFVFGFGFGLECVEAGVQGWLGGEVEGVGGLRG
ncbi:hypothetical protein RKD29_006610 [Streptomyces tendae]